MLSEFIGGMILLLFLSLIFGGGDVPEEFSREGWKYPSIYDEDEDEIE